MSPGGDPIRSAVRILIAILCAAALLLILTIMSGSEFDGTTGKAIWTAIACAFFGLTSMAGMSLAGRRPEIAMFGYLTAAISIAALAFLLGSIWFENLIDDDWNIVGDAIVLAVAGGHASLLLGSAREDDSDAVRLLRSATLAVLGLLAFLAVLEISSDGQDLNERLIGVIAVVYVLCTVLLPLVRRISPETAPSVKAATPGVRATAPGVGVPILRLDRVGIAVTERPRSDVFYRDVLGAEIVAGPDGQVAYRIGGQQLNVYAPGEIARGGPTVPVRPGESDLCFIWDGPLSTAIAHLQSHGVEIVDGPVSGVGNHGPGHSVYFRDPDGGLIALISYEGPSFPTPQGVG